MFSISNGVVSFAIIRTPPETIVFWFNNIIDLAIMELTQDATVDTLTHNRGKILISSFPLGQSCVQEIKHPDVCSVLDYGLMLTYASLPLFCHSASGGIYLQYRWMPWGS